jgi:hypothetical protein
VRCQDQRKRIASDQFKQARFVMPILEDANAVQMALMQIMQLLGSGQMEHKTAALMLYALQTASCNLRNTRFEASEVTDVVIDRDDVHRTSIGGPQWFEEDFEEGEEAEGGAQEEDALKENAAEAAAAQPATAEKPASEPEAATAEAKAATVNAKMTLDEAREKVRGVIHNWILDSVEGKARQELNQNQSGKISSTKPGTQ